MGGINHQPTSQISNEFTVPAAQALTQGMSELMLANTEIENTIMTTNTNYDIGRQYLQKTCSHLKQCESYLKLVNDYTYKIIRTLERSDYQPFSISNIDVDNFIGKSVSLELLPEAQSTHEASELMKNKGYTGLFVRITEQTAASIKLVDDLYELTYSMSEGAEGKQGYFWLTVETNRKPWRQLFSQTLTSMTYLLQTWSASALISTEVHLHGIDAPSLTTNIQELQKTTSHIKDEPY